MSEQNLPHPDSPVEEYLGVLCEQPGVEKPAHPSSSVERYLDYLCEHGGGGASSWDELEGKPFKTIGDGFEVINDALTAKIIDALTSMDAKASLSAKQGRELYQQITNLKNLGRFLSIWNASTGVATSNPPESPYTYKTGDYFRIGVVGNKIPTGATYTIDGTNYEVTTEELAIGDVYYFDGTVWRRQAAGSGGTVQDVQIDGISILNDGIANILLESAIAAMAVRYDASQSMTNSQKTQARTNIGAAAASDVVTPQNVTCYDESGVAHTYRINMQEVNI